MRPIRWLRRGIMLAGLGAAGGALIITARHILETPQPLQSALPGGARIDRKHGGDLYYNVAGAESAEPMVLLHDFYLGASNFEYRHIFPRLTPTWRVYAPDWLGFGMSEHPSLAYTGEFYANMLIGFLRDVVGRPAVIVGHGRAANIAARITADAPDLVSRLVLISPDVEAGVDLDPRPTQLLARAAQRVSLGLVPYAFLSTKPLLRRLARQRSALTGDGIANEETVEHLYASAHQFGGQHAQLALMTGELDLPIQNIFPLLQPPVLILSGDEDPAHPVEMMEDLAVLNPHADLDVLTSAGEAVFEDQPAMFTEALLDWLATAPTRQLPQVEEKHPALEAEGPAATADEAAAQEPEAPAVAEVIEPAEPADTADTIVPVETPGASASPDAPESAPARPSASAPATRNAPASTSAAVKPSAKTPTSAARTTGAKTASRTARPASQKSASAKPGTPSAKKPGSRGAGASGASGSSGSSARNGKAAHGEPQTKRSTRKAPGASRDTD
ncbi:MAG TPA: alpha/beta fold hydrolase [Ktedonobacterales bacterium]|jgi:pimeloyl-ACP methyl ester carboxylesterase|nr:alpha/beta fold hydrolase [Ktedonobacterales bacterium]